MFIGRRLPFRLVAFGALPQFMFAAVWSSVLIALYAFIGFDLVRLPFLPIATIGTAVAFYVGFKNNSAYDRFWEGRKIWGGVVNSSRTFANATLAYVYDDEDRAARRVLVRRQLAWINALRIQLREKSRFKAWREKQRERYRWIQEHDEALRMSWDDGVASFLSEEEAARVKAAANPAAQILRVQAEHLKALHDEGKLDLFRQLDLMRVIEELYALQGKCERIKNTPFPRQYAFYARVFTYVFITLAPCGLLDVFGDELTAATLLTMTGLMDALALVISAGLIAWVFMTMEFIGDYSEDPFERSMSDVPMNALCRTIEIDLIQMLGDEDVPEPERPVGNVLY